MILFQKKEKADFMNANIRRIALYAMVAILAVLLVNAWVKDYPPSSRQPVTDQPSTTEASGTSFSPSTFNPATADQTKASAAATAAKSMAGEPASGQWISVKTDVFEIQIDVNNGNIISAKLPEYPISEREKNIPVQILNHQPDEWYVAQSGITDTPSTISFTSDKKNYELLTGQDELIVSLVGHTPNGLTLTKIYTFKRGSYAVRLSYDVANAADKTWSGSLYTQIARRKPSTESHTFYTRSYNGAAISSPETPYQKVSYEDMDEKNITRSNKGGWVAMQQHYFLTAWVPGNLEMTHHYYTHVTAHSADGENVYVIGFVSPQMSIPPNGKASSDATIYIGSEIGKNLRTLAPGLDHTIDYGWLWPVSVIIFWIMQNIDWVVRNWGVAIILTTILIKILFYPLTAKSFRSMARMRELQPKMQVLKERYGDDRQALSKATMELYRKEKINPLGGCLPMLIQVPVFIALYYVLIESVELRQAPFIFWIHDLSTKDPYYVLPILMGLSMLAQQWLSPTATDPTQQKMMWVLPIVFTVFFLHFPSGLVLYWFVNNVVQVLQQWYVNKTFEKHKAKLTARKHKKKK